jgi:hypothetical protein
LNNMTITDWWSLPSQDLLRLLQEER